MNRFSLVTASLRRKPIRTCLTMLGIVIAFLLFGLLQGVNSAFSAAIGDMKLDRLFVESRFESPLPLAYRRQIERVPGVGTIATVSLLSGYYQDPKNNIVAIASDPATWLTIRPEYRVSDDEVAAATHTRNGAIITEWMARRYGLRIGDQLTVRTRDTKTDGSPDWTFVVTGIMKYADTTAELRFLLVNFDYYDEARVGDRGTADRFVLRIDNPMDGAHIARRIDALFATSGVQTRTQTEKEMEQSRIARMGDINFFTHAVMAAVFFTLLVMTGNTMMESVRERTREFAILRALGYSDRALLLQVMVEASVLCVVASVAGLAVAAAIFPLARSYLPTATLPLRVVFSGVAIAVCVALLSAVFPAWRAVRLQIVDGLTVR